MAEKSRDNFVNLDNARLDEQRVVMEGIIDDAVCPFCIESLRKYHHKPILKQGEQWLLTENQWPYANTRHHFLAIARQHAEVIDELPRGAGDELIELFAWATREYDIQHGGLAMRFGSVALTGATVSHLHAHLIEPEIDLPREQKVRFKIG